MGVGKILSFYFGAGFTLLISFATVWFACLVYRRRKEKGFLWLAIAVALQLLGLLVSRIVFSPVTIVEYPVKEWLMPLAFYAPAIASIVALVGWFLLSRKKKEPNQSATDNSGAAPRRV